MTGIDVWVVRIVGIALAVSAWELVPARAYAQERSGKVVTERNRDDHVNAQLLLDAAAHSSVVKQGEGYYEFKHRICNKLPTRTLTFKWQAAGFGSGSVRALPGQMCSVFRREVGWTDSGEQLWFVDVEANVAYTTKEALMPISTLRNKMSERNRFLERSLAVVGLEGLATGKLAEGTEVSIAVELRDSSIVEHRVKWGSDVLAVVLAIPSRSAEQLNEIRRQLSSQPQIAERARTLTAEELSAVYGFGPDTEVILSHFGNSERTVVLLQSTSGTGGEAQFSVRLPGTSRTFMAREEPAVVLDYKGYVQSTIQYSTPQRLSEGAR